MVEQQNFADPFEGFASPVFFKGKDGLIYGRITLKHMTAGREKWGAFWGFFVFGPFLAVLLGGGGGFIGVIIGYCLGLWIAKAVVQKTTTIVLGAWNIRIDNKNYDIRNPVNFCTHVHPKSSEAKGIVYEDPKGRPVKSVYDRAWLSCVEINGQPIVMAEFLDRGQSELLWNRVRGVVNAIRRDLVTVS